VEILLITSIRKKRWIIPKGFIEFNLSAFESAKKEAFEEAGILGTNETIELGTFTSQKYGYPEKNLRKRKWFTVEEAKEKVYFPEVGNMILKLHDKLKTGIKEI
jgi:8-oxo-dGTP pyrophosphatase MutT (NUDIX family)